VNRQIIISFWILLLLPTIIIIIVIVYNMYKGKHNYLPLIIGSATASVVAMVTLSFVYTVSIVFPEASVAHPFVARTTPTPFSWNSPALSSSAVQPLPICWKMIRARFTPPPCRAAFESLPNGVTTITILIIIITTTTEFRATHGV